MKSKRFSISVGPIGAVSAVVVMSYYNLWTTLGTAGSFAFGLLLLLLTMSGSGLSYSKGDTND